ncbi:MAG TPA: hypothetical protein VGG29_10945 [Caulobacteraceae bacterium]
MPRIRDYDPSFADQAVAGGRKGWTRAEIASDLGASQIDFEAWAAAHEDFAAALGEADNEARAWWDRLPARAVTSGEPFRATIWAKLYASRFGRPSHSPSQPRKPAAEPKPADEPFDILAEFDLPDDGLGPKPPRGRSRR